MIGDHDAVGTTALACHVRRLLLKLCHVVDPAVRYCRERTAMPTWSRVHPGTRDVVVDGVRIVPLPALCREVGIP